MSEGIFNIRLGILGEWWCAPVEASDNDVAKAILEKGSTPVSSPDLVADRCVGGFQCDDPGRRHVYLSSGSYTYLGDNRPMTPDERAELVAEVVTANASGYLGDGPMTSDKPAPTAS